MPIPVPAWSGSVPVDAKSLNLALYSSNGTGDFPQGIAFLAQRPTFFEAYDTPAVTFPASSAGSTSAMTSGSASACFVVYDTAGYYGQTSDQAGEGLYRFSQVINGSAGDGVNPGGWEVLSHVAPLSGRSTQTSVSADMLTPLGSLSSGSRQLPGTISPSAPFFADLVSVGAAPNIWKPAVSIHDSGGNASTLQVNDLDSSGQTPRFYAFYAAPSETSVGMAEFIGNGTYSFTAPTGVTSVTVSAIGAGGGGGAGDASGGGTEYGGGGGGGGQFAQGTIAVTPGNNYTVTVGAGGAGGTQPGGNGGTGGSSGMTGDAATVTGHAGIGGTGATTSADGAGGNGGTGTSTGATTTFNGGNGATGVTGTYGGGGGGSAGTAHAGNNGSKSAGGTAVSGGGPGGPGGSAVVTVVQDGHDANNGFSSLTMKFNAPVQAGNCVFAAVLYQANTFTGSKPTVKLGSTTMSQQINANVSASVGLQIGIFQALNVAGGETKITVTGDGTGDQVLVCEAIEVSGLGTSPTIDDSNATTGNGTTYSSTAHPTAGPDLWMGTVGGNSTGSFTINAPAGWTSPNQSGGVENTFHAALRTGWRSILTGGTAKYSGTFSGGVNHGTIVIAFTASPATPGQAPSVPPGGGGGGGLGLNNGGNGDDGQVILTWTTPAGSGYGTPAIPAPYTAWGPSTRIGSNGTSASIDVDLNASVTNVVNFLTSPPVYRIGAQLTQSIPTATLGTVSFSGITSSVDTYSGGSVSSYNVQRDGLYLFHGLVSFAADSAGTRQAGATVNGTTYWGPGYPAVASGFTNATKTQIFDLQSGDTVSLACRQDSGISLALASGSLTRFMLVWLGELGVPSTQWVPPDPSYRWASGTDAAELPALFSQYLGNDLSFLSQRPYLLAYAGTATTGISTSAFQPVVLGSVSGLIHGSAGDSYSGWTAGTTNAYTAQQPGWYLVCGEVFTSSSSTAGANVAAGVEIPTSGGVAPSVAVDSFQQSVVTATASVGGGATVLGIEYLLAGESVMPVMQGHGYSGNTYSTLAGTANSGRYFPHFEAVWLSELPSVTSLPRLVTGGRVVSAPTAGHPVPLIGNGVLWGHLMAIDALVATQCPQRF